MKYEYEKKDLSIKTELAIDITLARKNVFMQISNSAGKSRTKLLSRIREYIKLSLISGTCDFSLAYMFYGLVLPIKFEKD